MKVLIGLLFSFSAFGATDCSLFMGRACVYVPDNTTSSTIHLYIRGHHKGRRDLPAGERSVVARTTLESPVYGLKKLKLSTIVSGSSAVSFTMKDIGEVELKYGLKFTDIIISAHSGGYFGLNETLLAFSSDKGLVKKILMLDNFYSIDENGLLKNLKEYTDTGSVCAGFMTSHNAVRAKKYPFCKIKGPSFMDHEKSVWPTLKANL